MGFGFKLKSFMFQVFKDNIKNLNLKTFVAIIIKINVDFIKPETS